MKILELAKKLRTRSSLIIEFAIKSGYRLESKSNTITDNTLIKLIELRFGNNDAIKSIECPICGQRIAGNRIAMHINSHTASKSKLTNTNKKVVKSLNDNSNLIPNAKNNKCPYCNKFYDDKTIQNHISQHERRINKPKRKNKNNSKKRGRFKKGSNVILSPIKRKEKFQKEFGKKIVASIPLTSSRDIKEVEVFVKNIEISNRKLNIHINDKIYEYENDIIKIEYNHLINLFSEKVRTYITIRLKNEKIDWNTGLESFLNYLKDGYHQLSCIHCNLCNQYLPTGEFRDHELICQEFEAEWKKRINAIEKNTNENKPKVVTKATIENNQTKRRETLLDICRSILKQRDLERFCKMQTVGRLMLKDQQKDKEFLWWIYNDIPGNSIIHKDLNGRVIGSTSNPDISKVSKGSAISKNSKLVGDLLISKTASVTMKNGRVLKLKNKSNYKPGVNGITHNISIEHLITGRKNEKEIYWGKLNALIIELDNIIREYRNQKTDRELVSLLNEKLNNASIEELFKDAKPFIRDSIKLKNQDILAPEQESAKRGYVFDGTTLVIDGGPGTGKTTTLVQRIRFLSSPTAIIEYFPDISQSMYQKVINTKGRNWVFYSPSILLSEYLKDNMAHEGLETTTEYIKIWSKEKYKLIEDYGLKSIESTSTNFLKYIDIEEYNEAFTAYHLQQNQDSLQGKTAYVFKTSKCKSLSKRINSHRSTLFEDLGKPNTIDAQYRWYKSLYYYYDNDHNEDDSILKLYKRHKSKIDLTIDELWKNLSQDDKLEIRKLIPNKIIKEEIFDLQKYIIKATKGTIKKMVNLSTGKKVKLNKLQELLSDKISINLDFNFLLADLEINLLYSHYRYLGNSFANFFLSNLKQSYSKFKSNYFQTRAQNNVDIDEMKKWCGNDYSFFIGAVNEYIIKLYNSNYITKETTHKYITQYHNNSKNIIAVDEASDLNLYDLKNIYSFRDHDISSVTFCGDIMQRMTTDGIEDWQDLDKFIEGHKPIELKTSFRQSPTLLVLAREIYKRVTDNQAKYKSHLNKHKSEPKPLLFVESDFEKRIDWISQRIKDVYLSYGKNLPSTAIFVPDSASMSFVVALLNKITNDQAYSFVVYNPDFELAAKSNVIPVFSVDQIKGLEFEVVFFIDLQNLEEKVVDPDILLRYVYVGLSRAAYYFGMTSPELFKGKLKFLNRKLKQNSTWS